jgi:hypothetical protein
MIYDYVLLGWLIDIGGIIKLKINNLKEKNESQTNNITQ